MKKNISSRLRQKLTLQHEVRAADGSGGFTRSWENVSDVWAEILPVSSRERLIATQIESEITHRIYIRARSGVEASQRLIGDGRTFHIQSVVLIEKNSELELLVEERAAI